MYKVIYNGEMEKVAGKVVFGETMKALLAEDKDVVYLDADLMNSVGTAGLEVQFPDQAFDVGIQEANMAGVAGGLSAVGKKPYIHSFGCFASRRMFDQAFISIAYAQLSALGWHLWAQLKIHADENVGDIERYDRRMIDYATCRTLPPIPKTLLPGENRA